MKKVEVKLKAKSYPILIEASSLFEVGSLINENMGSARGALITDETVDRLYGDKLISSLKSGGLDFEKLVVEPGEGSKSLETSESLYEKLAQLNLHRDSLILAFGGGVIGDLAGFVGSTFLRGLPVIQIPTTLLAQVDSSVGGKTAVNLSRGKNLVGTFHQPELVIIDPRVLTTLSKSDVRSGLGEVLKYGLIRDGDFFERVVNNKSLFNDFDDYRELEKIISRCCEIKAEVVTEDELDKGVRRILNFGHTLGHGVEAGAGYGEIKHGEAVIWGMIGESWISMNRGYLGKEEFSDLVGVLTEMDLPPLPENLPERELLEYVKRDKKVRSETINCVLIKDSIGEVVVEEVDETEVKEAWNYLTELEVEV